MYVLCVVEPSMTSLAGGDSRDDSRGMLENMYENVASIKAATAAAAAGNSASLRAKPYPEKAAIGGAGSSFSAAAAVPDSDNSPAYQPGLPINYPSSSGFSSGHLLEPFYEAYIIKPKPVYACSSNPTKPDIYAGTLTSRCTWLV